MFIQTDSNKQLKQKQFQLHMDQNQVNLFSSGLDAHQLTSPNPNYKSGQVLTELIQSQSFSITKLKFPVIRRGDV